MRIRTVVATVAAALSAAAGAQTVPPAAAPDLVVEAGRKAVDSTIDRKAYAVDRDLQAAAGSVADVLRNLPQVGVDAEGNVSLRGDANVQVLIDGKPSAQMVPATRADALRSLPANGIESIEVITSPSARFKAEGSGGVINIITKKNRKPGPSGTTAASVGSDGRFNLGATAAYRRGGLDLNAALTLRRTVPVYRLADRRTGIDSLGITTGSRQDVFFISHRTAKIATLGAGYDLTAADRLSGSFTYNTRHGSPLQLERNQLFGPAGALTGDSDRNERAREYFVATDGSATFKHSFAGKGHALTLDLRHGEQVEGRSSRFTTLYRLPVLPATIDQRRPHFDQREREATVEYARPMAAAAKLLLGYDVEREDDGFDTSGDTVDAAGIVTPDPRQTSSFVYARTVHSFYGTYERVFADKLTMILGVRVEATSADALQVTIARVDRTAYVTAYPTLHFDYALSDAKTLRLSYSHRIVRPDPGDLDPYPVFADPLNLRVGNPQLEPQQTDTVEGAFAYAAHGLSAEATPYYRRTTNLFTQVVRFVTPTQLLTTQANLGTSTAMGIDFSVNGTLAKGLTFELSGSVFRNSIDAANLGIAGTRTIVSGTAKGSLDVKVTPKDAVQLTANFNGRRLLPQGYRLADATANLGLRHQLKPTLSVVVTLVDVFDSLKDRTAYDTPSLRTATTRRRSGRTGTIALSWTLGGASRPARIDYTE